MKKYLIVFALLLSLTLISCANISQSNTSKSNDTTQTHPSETVEPDKNSTPLVDEPPSYKIYMFDSYSDLKKSLTKKQYTK